MPRTRRYGWPRRVLVVVLGAVLLCLAGACRLDATVEVDVQEDGTGSVVAAVGLDAAALERLGDPDTVVLVDDLRATGWDVPPAAREADGLTWIRGTKRFTTLEQATAILGELTGPQGAFRDFSVTKDEGLASTTWDLVGTVDLSKGYAGFSDAELDAALPGPPLGGQIEAAEQASGRPAADMTSVKLVVKLPHAEPQTFTPKMGDPTPTKIEASGSKTLPIPLPLGGGSGGSAAVVGGLGLAGVVVITLGVLRRRFRMVGR